jgi:N,N'-diacetyllegionaminate synthase
LRRLFTRSVVVTQALPAGAVLRRDQLAIKKPGTGLSPDRLDDVVGKRLRRSVEADHVLDAADVEGLA